MRITRTLVGAVAVGVLAVGCGSGGSGGDGGAGAGSAAGSGSGAEGDGTRTGGASEGEELPVKIDAPVEELIEGRPKITPRPSGNASETERVIHDLREKTLGMAGVEGRTTGSCAGGGITMEAGATSTCTVTYEGLDVPWKVTISDSYEPGKLVFSYRAEPQKGLLTAKGVGGEFYKQQSRRGIEEVRCSEIPDAELVELEAETQHRCQYLLDKGGEKRWSVRAVTVRASGPSFGLPKG